MRLILYYFCGSLILTYYGREVCTFLEGLFESASFFIINQWYLVLLSFFTAFYLLRMLLNRTVVEYSEKKDKVKIQFIFDLVLFSILGLTVGSFNLIYYDFPIGSGLKVLFGCLTIGFFASIDVALETERKIIKGWMKNNKKSKNEESFFSLPKKFLALSVIEALFIAGILLLLIIKDFQWLANNMSNHKVIFSSVITEIVFVIGVLFSLQINLIYSYSKNFRLYLDNEVKILKKVSIGDLNKYVPVVSNDEFGLIASHTNNMIDELKEKNRLKDMFGKLVAPEIAERFFDAEGKPLVIAEKQKVVVMFSDIRNFTTLTEKTDPEVLFKSLNYYLTEMVNIVHANKGMIDKFIGDGILAVFGVKSNDANSSNDDQNESEAIKKALIASIEMQKTVLKIGDKVQIPIKIGVGLHQGEVLAGFVGSQDRCEFTFIGDTVNTAARLESMTKPLNTNIIISSTLYHLLPKDLIKLPWKDHGEQSLKGKAKGTQLYGINIEESYLNSTLDKVLV